MKNLNHVGNLGGYQVMATLAKSVGGPAKLARLVFRGGFVSGAAVLGDVILAAKWITGAVRRKRQKAAAAVVYTVRVEGTSNEGLAFHPGEMFRVLNTYGDAALIEKIGEQDTPCLVSARYLSGISDYVQI